MDDYHRGLLMQMQRELLEKSSLTHHGLCHLMLCVLAQECSDYHQLPNRLKIVGELHPEWCVFDFAWTASGRTAYARFYRWLPVQWLEPRLHEINFLLSR